MGFPCATALSKYVLPFVFTLRPLHSIFPRDLLLQVYKIYIQHHLDYGITFYGCSTQKNIDLVEIIQNHAARFITGNFDYIYCRELDLVKSLNLYIIGDRRHYFLTLFMFKAIHGIAPTYLSDSIVMNFDVNGYDTRGSDMKLYLPTLRKEVLRSSFMYMGGQLWNDLPEFVQNSTDVESFTPNYTMHKLIISSWWMMPWLIDPVWVIRSVHWCWFFCILIGTYYWIMFETNCRCLAQELNRV